MNCNDFVILKKEILDIEPNSVGIVREINDKQNLTRIFFIGKNIEIALSLDCIEYLDVTKTGKAYKYKICNVCHILKDYFEDFDINQTDAKGAKTTRPSCKVCRVDIDGVSMKNSEKQKCLEILKMI